MTTAIKTPSETAAVLWAIAQLLEAHPELKTPIAIDALSTGPRLQVRTDDFRNWVQAADSYNVGAVVLTGTGKHIEAAVTVAGMGFDIHCATISCIAEMFIELVSIDPMVKVAT